MIHSANSQFRLAVIFDYFDILGRTDKLCENSDDKTGVINDPLGQPTVSAGSEDLLCF